METDFQYILTACLSLLKKYSLQIAEPEGDCYEDFDHYRLYKPVINGVVTSVTNLEEGAARGGA